MVESRQSVGHGGLAARVARSEPVPQRPSQYRWTMEWATRHGWKGFAMGSGNDEAAVGERRGPAGGFGGFWASGGLAGRQVGTGPPRAGGPQPAARRVAGGGGGAPRGGRGGG